MFAAAPRRRDRAAPLRRPLASTARSPSRSTGASPTSATSRSCPGSSSVSRRGRRRGPRAHGAGRRPERRADAARATAPRRRCPTARVGRPGSRRSAPTMARVPVGGATPTSCRPSSLAVGSAYDADTPVVIAHRVSWPDERIVDTTVGRARRRHLRGARRDHDGARAGRRGLRLDARTTAADAQPRLRRRPTPTRSAARRVIRVSPVRP